MTQTSLLVFARCIGFLARAPGFSHPSVPSVVRAGVALSLTLALAARCRSVHLGTAAFVLAVVSEVLLGTALGLAAALFSEAAYGAGRLLDDVVGIRGSVPTASLAGSTGFGRLLSSLYSVGFFTLGAYGPMLAAFASGFDALAPGAALATTPLREFALAYPVALVRAALSIAGPALAMALVLQIALAAVARVVPRLAAFALSFPLVFAGALLAVLCTAPLVGMLAERTPHDFHVLQQP